MIKTEDDIQEARGVERKRSMTGRNALSSKFVEGQGPLGAIFRRIVGAVVGLPLLDACHAAIRGKLNSGEESNFFEAALSTLGVEYRVSQDMLERIPQEGPVLVVANHPFGIVDGLMLGAMLSRRRSDFRLLLNYLLLAVPELKEWAIPVDPFGGRATAGTNGRPLREALAWLDGGGCLATFPAGKVSRWDKRAGGPLDGKWSQSVALLAQRSGAAVVPLWFEGGNSMRFHAASALHPRLGTGLLLREAFNKRGMVCRIDIGKPIGGRRLGGFENRRLAVSYLRLACYALGERNERTEATEGAALMTGQPIARRESPISLADEVALLDETAALFRKGAYSVYAAKAAEIPLLLREIGRVREETFRPVGEGTGKEVDLDGFDFWYRHLFIWDQERCAVVGAYRLAFVDEVLTERGPEGLYCNGLYDLNAELLGQLGPAIELGRSFVATEYQRDGASLSLLWRGIGELVGRNPQYTTLFGAVSMTDAYRPLSKLLMMEYLGAHKAHGSLGGKVRARVAPKIELGRRLTSLVVGAALPSLEDVSALVSSIEPDGKGAPTLLKHYLRLNGLIASFGIDQGFNDALDGFVVVDLLKTDRRLLKKYLGAEAYRRFAARHGF